MDNDIYELKSIYQLWHKYFMASDKYLLLCEKVENIKKDVANNIQLNSLINGIVTGQGINFYHKYDEAIKDQIIFKDMNDINITNHEYFLLNKYLYFFNYSDFEKCWVRIKDYLDKENTVLPDAEDNESVDFLYLNKNVKYPNTQFLETQNNDHTAGFVPITTNLYKENTPIQAIYKGGNSIPVHTGQFVCYINLNCSIDKLEIDFKNFIRKKKKNLENLSILPFIPFECKRNHFKQIERYLKVYEMEKKNIDKDEIWAATITTRSNDAEIAPDHQITDEVRKDKEKAEKIIKNVEKGIFPGKYPIGKR